MALDFERMLREAQNEAFGTGTPPAPTTSTSNTDDDSKLHASLSEDHPDNIATLTTENMRDSVALYREYFRKQVTMTPVSSLNLEDFRVGDIPSLYYIPKFLSTSEENDLGSCVYDAPSSAWTQLKRRRLQMWGGKPSANGLKPKKIPSWCDSLIEKISGALNYPERPNHILVNEYEPGQGIAPHQDGPIYHKRVAILSLRGSVRLNFYRTLSDSADRENDRCALSLLVEPRSLLVFTDELYTDYWHGISEVESDLITDKVVNRDACSKIVGEEVQRERTRLSLTVRHVPLEPAES